VSASQLSDFAARWNWKSTLDTIVLPAVAAGWTVDYFGYFQRGPMMKREAHTRSFAKSDRRDVPWNDSAEQFEADLTAAGGHVRSLRPSEDTEQAKEVSKHFIYEGSDGPHSAKDGRSIPSHSGHPAQDTQQFWNLLQAHRAFASYVASNPVSYTWVLRVREDTGWFAKVDLDLAKIGVTYFRECEDWGGISDKVRGCAPLGHHTRSHSPQLLPTSTVPNRCGLHLRSTRS
jgi:hypothetical protein